MCVHVCVCACVCVCMCVCACVCVCVCVCCVHIQYPLGMSREHSNVLTVSDGDSKTLNGLHAASAFFLVGDAFSLVADGSRIVLHPI